MIEGRFKLPKVLIKSALKTKVGE